MADKDPQLELKKRARRRLVGALALALAAVIVLPMLMDREPRPASSDLQIRIPSQEGSNFASRAIKGTAPVPVAPSEPLAPQSQAAPAQPPKPLAPVEPPVPPSESKFKPSPESSAKPKAEATKSEERKPKPEEHKQAPKKPEPAHKPDEATRARSILEGKGEHASEEKKDQSAYYVQLGVYRDADNARDVQKKAAALGVKCSLEKAGEATRVRVGPFADRVAAEQLVARLKGAGLPGFVAAK